MLHHKCGARCPAYDGCSVCVCPSTPYESGNYNLKCVSLRVDENGAVEYKKRGGKHRPTLGSYLRLARKIIISAFDLSLVLFILAGLAVFI